MIVLLGLSLKISKIIIIFSQKNNFFLKKHEIFYKKVLTCKFLCGILLTR